MGYNEALKKLKGIVQDIGNDEWERQRAQKKRDKLADQLKRLKEAAAAAEKTARNTFERDALQGGSAAAGQAYDRAVKGPNAAVTAAEKALDDLDAQIKKIEADLSDDWKEYMTALAEFQTESIRHIWPGGN